jgi:16S rRNA (cytosine1402-N4)-methyltransferase
VNSRFSELLSNEIVKSHKYSGILFDLGVNSAQLDTAERGFSFQTDAMLDMRMDTRLGVTAKDLVNGLGRKELYDLLENNAQEHHSRAIVGALLRSRLMKPIETTRELAAIIQGAVPPRPSKGKSIHPATKTFLALRMAVNDELGEIERALPTALDLLSPSGRLVVLAFHETEDRIIKHTFKTWEEEGLGVSLTKKPMMPSEEECMNNPRSRSAKLRAFEKRKEE